MIEALSHTWEFFFGWIVFTLVILPVGLHWLEKHEAKRYQRLIDKPGE